MSLVGPIQVLSISGTRKLEKYFNHLSMIVSSHFLSKCLYTQKIRSFDHMSRGISLLNYV